MKHEKIEELENLLKPILLPDLTNIDLSLNPNVMITHSNGTIKLDEELSNVILGILLSGCSSLSEKVDTYFDKNNNTIETNNSQFVEPQGPKCILVNGDGTNETKYGNDCQVRIDLN